MTPNDFYDTYSPDFITWCPVASVILPKIFANSHVLGFGFTTVNYFRTVNKAEAPDIKKQC